MEEGTSPKIIDDGCDALSAEIGLCEIASRIERTACRFDPATYRLLPLGSLGTRGHLLYKGNWSAPQMDTQRTGNSVHDVAGNLYANHGLALGPRECDQSQVVVPPAAPLAGVRAMLSLKHDVVVVRRRDSA